MALHSIAYNTLGFAEVTNLVDFYRTRLPETHRVKSIFENLKNITKLPGDKIILSVAEGERIYKYTIFAPGVRKIILGWLVYIPKTSRLDLYMAEDPVTPICQWKNKLVVFKNYSSLLDLVGLDRLFDRVVNAS